MLHLHTLYFHFSCVNFRDVAFRKIMSSAKVKCSCATSKCSYGISINFNLKTDEITVVLNEALTNLKTSVKFMSCQLDGFGITSVVEYYEKYKGRK